jgi:hypothetical protein
MATTTGTVTNATSASYVEYSNVADKPALISGSSQVSYTGLSDIPAGIVSGSAQIGEYGVFATTGSNQFNGSQAVTGSLTVTGQVVAQTLNVQQVTSSIVFSSGSNIFGNDLGNTQQFTGSLQVTGSTHYLLGNVGVGIAIPTNPLHIVSNTLSQLNIQALSGNTNAQINLEPTGTGIALIGPANNVDFAFRTNATERLRITSGGNVGIGTNDPQSVLNGFSSSARGLAISNTYPFIGLNDTDGGNFYVGTQANLAYVWNGGSDAMIFATNNAERMRITSGGNVLIGTPTSNNHKLEIIGGATSGLRIDVNSGVSGIAMSPGAEFNIDQPGVGGGTFKINSSGNVGIGTNSPNVLGFTKALTISSTNSGIELTSADNIVQGSFSGSTNGLAISGVGENGIRFLSSSSGSATERMRITSGGLVRIGPVTDSDGTLQVRGLSQNTYNSNGYNGTGANIRLLPSSTGGTNITTGISMGVGGAAEAYIGAVQQSNTLADIVFQTFNGSAYGERMRITSGGNVGIGNTNPSGKLSVNDAVYGEYLRIVNGLIGGNETSVYLAWNNGGNITLQQVTVGAADSGGSGFRLLRIPNT